MALDDLALKIMAQIDVVSGLEQQLKEIERRVKKTGSFYECQIDNVSYELTCMEKTVMAYCKAMLQDG